MIAPRPPISEIKIAEAADLANAVQRAVEGKTHPLILFEEGALRFHQPLVAQLAENLEGRARTVWFEGEEMLNATAFFDAVRRAIPTVGYMGSNLDAFGEVLHGAALSDDPEKMSCWIWTNCDVLFQKDIRLFWQVFDMICDAAKRESEGWYRPEHWRHPGESIPARQQVAIIFTGRWDVMRDEATRANSLLYQLSDRHAMVLKDLSTGVATFKVVVTP